jgi:hypothetical protein
MTTNIPIAVSQSCSPFPPLATVSTPGSSQDESILALFELAARQTHDHDLVRHFNQVIASKRRVIPASQ